MGTASRPCLWPQWHPLRGSSFALLCGTLLPASQQVSLYCVSVLSSSGWSAYMGVSQKLAITPSAVLIVTSLPTPCDVIDSRGFSDHP